MAYLTEDGLGREVRVSVCPRCGQDTLATKMVQLFSCSNPTAEEREARPRRVLQTCGCGYFRSEPKIPGLTCTVITGSFPNCRAKTYA